MKAHQSTIDTMLRAGPVDEAAQQRLHERLVKAAQEEGILDLVYRTVDSPVGTLLLAATEQGLVRVAFDLEGHDEVLARLAERISPRILRSPRRLAEVAREFDEYFDGRRTRFDLPVDLRLATGFRREVLSHLTDIGYGHTASYAAVAATTGSPRAVRAVGTACATNPVPLIIPCHRVVRSDGSPGRYAGGEEAKLALLALESGGLTAGGR
jgi:methylated-DNA-[protein]-cysteine S-methyltransferase